jgi:periplasmic divalent cation tolerance protein
MAFTPRIVFVTVPTLEEARNLAQGLLTKKLAACVNLVPGVESHYWWQEKLETSAEVLMLIKTTAEQFEAVAEHIRWHHSYDVPEIVALAPENMSPEYQAWWKAQAGETA